MRAQITLSLTKSEIELLETALSIARMAQEDAIYSKYGRRVSIAGVVALQKRIEILAHADEAVRRRMLESAR